jgi:hypothetical protein
MYLDSLAALRNQFPVLPLAGIKMLNSGLADDLVLFRQMKDATMKAIGHDLSREVNIRLTVDKIIRHSWLRKIHCHVLRSRHLFLPPAR